MRAITQDVYGSAGNVLSLRRLRSPPSVTKDLA